MTAAILVVRKTKFSTEKNAVAIERADVASTGLARVEAHGRLDVGGALIAERESASVQGPKLEAAIAKRTDAVSAAKAAEDVLMTFLMIAWYIASLMTSTNLPMPSLTDDLVAIGLAMLNHLAPVDSAIGKAGKSGLEHALKAYQGTLKVYTDADEKLVALDAAWLATYDKLNGYIKLARAMQIFEGHDVPKLKKKATRSKQGGDSGPPVTVQPGPVVVPVVTATPAVTPVVTTAPAAPAANGAPAGTGTPGSNVA